MFIRKKRAGKYDYLQVVEKHREGRHTRQRVVATLGRLDRLQADGDIDTLMRSLGRFSTQVKLQEAHSRGDLRALGAWSIEPELIFGRLLNRLKLPAIIKGLLEKRKFEFDVERATFVTVLHRLSEAGSDRQAARWMTGVFVPGAEGIQLHHLYRAMRWQGRVKDRVEDGLFSAHRDLFTELSLVFFDTTSIYFEGRGGETLRGLGCSKDHRGDDNQVVVGALLTETGRPISCDVAPGNQVDVAALLPMVDRARARFGLKRVCWVADRGMCSKDIIEGLEERQMEYILGVRMRAVKEALEDVLSRAGRYRDVEDNLKVKEVWVGDRRYMLCYNPEEAAKDKACREAILEALEEQPERNPKALVSPTSPPTGLDRGALGW